MPPTVSICVPTYNGEAYLAESLDSVLAQTFADVEVLVVDDGSSDGTVELAAAYAGRDARVRVERNPRNLGLVANWNRCVELARGEWIKFAFQDDLLAPTCVERLVAAARAAGRPIASCSRDFIAGPGTSEEQLGDYLEHRALVDRLVGGDLSAEQFSAIVLDYPLWNLLGEPTVVLLHRDAFARYGLFNERMVQYVDGEYWARVGTAAGVVHLPDRLASFRIHGGSASARNNGPRRARMQLDLLVLQHEYAYGAGYAGLRAVRARTRPDIDLSRRFREDAYRIMVERGVEAEIDAGDARTRTEAAQVYAAYPRLRRARWYGLRHAAAGLAARHPAVARTYRGIKRVVGRAASLVSVAPGAARPPAPPHDGAAGP